MITRSDNATLPVFLFYILPFFPSTTVNSDQHQLASSILLLFLSVSFDSPLYLICVSGLFISFSVSTGSVFVLCSNGLELHDNKNHREDNQSSYHKLEFYFLIFSVFSGIQRKGVAESQIFSWVRSIGSE